MPIDITDKVEKYNADSLNHKIESLKLRVEHLRAENETLKDEREQGQKETHEFVAYFQCEMEKKDEIVNTLSTELESLRTKSNDELTIIKATYEDMISTITDKNDLKVKELSTNLSHLEDEMKVLSEFKTFKDSLEGKLKHAQDENNILKTKHEEELAMLSINEATKLRSIKKEMKDRLLEIELRAREEAQIGLDSDTRKIIIHNRAMGEELKFQLETTDDLQKQNKKAETAASRLAREVALKRDKEKVYALQSYKKSREINELKSKVKNLERSLSQVVREFAKERQHAKTTTENTIEKLNLEASGLRQLVKLKSKELRTMKRLAQTVLDQRSDVETYFLEALEQVKTEIRLDRVEEHKRNVAEYNQRMREATIRGKRGKGSSKFPSIRAPHQLVGVEASSNLPTEPSKKIDLRDLSWEDRERVLRLLFAKINNVQGYVDVMPSHSLGMSTGRGEGIVGEIYRSVTPDALNGRNTSSSPTTSEEKVSLTPKVYDMHSNFVSESLPEFA